jgi:excisionase family DNA binding protein
LTQSDRRKFAVNSATLPQSGYLTVAEVAGHLRMSRMTVYRLIEAGDLPAIRIGTRSYRISAEAFHRYLAGLTLQPAPAPHIPGQTEIPA